MEYQGPWETHKYFFFLVMYMYLVFANQSMLFYITEGIYFTLSLEV